MADSWPEYVAAQGLEWRITASEAMDAMLLLSATDPIFTPTPEPSDFEIPLILQTRMYELAQPTAQHLAVTMTDRLAAASDIIAWNSAELTKAKDALEIWTGTAADNFGEYLTSMHGAAINLKGIMVGVGKVTEAYSSVVKAMHTDFKALIDKYSTAIHEARLDQFRVGLAVVGAIPAIIAGGGLGAVITGGTSVAQSMVGASNELEVWRSFALALRYLRETFEGEIRRIVDGYKYVVEKLLLNPDRLPGVNPDAPKLITQKAFDPVDFALPDSPQFERNKHRVDNSDLVPTPKRNDIDKKLDPRPGGR